MCTCYMNCQQEHELRPHIVKPRTPYSYRPDYYRPSPYRKPMLPHDGRRSRAHPGKLPKMNNSERGKYYRQKYKAYEDGLEEAAVVLTKQIQDLSLFLQLRDALTAKSSLRHCSGIMVAQIFQLVTSGDKRHASSSSSRHGISSEISSSLWTRMNLHHHTPLQFELQAFQISCCSSDSPVVTLQGVLHTKYTQQTLTSLYPHIFQRAELVQRLVDQHVRLPTTFQFYFGSDGALQQYAMDSDLVHGLYGVLHSLDNVDFVLSSSSSSISSSSSSSSSSVATTSAYAPTHHTSSKHVDDQDTPTQIRTPEPLSFKSEASSGSPMNLGFILC